MFRWYVINTYSGHEKKVKQNLEHRVSSLNQTRSVRQVVVPTEDEIEIRTFHVRTRQGPRRFQTLRDEWPRPMPDGGILLRDVAGDLYLVRDPAQLDRASRAHLWPLLD